MLFCYRGKSNFPPDSLRPGEIVTDDSGRRWAYTGESQDDSRDGAVFVAHVDRPQPLPACSPIATPVSEIAYKGELECRQTIYQYRDDLRTIRYDYPGDRKKDFQPQFFFNGRWNAGSGSEIWPFYGSLASEGDAIIEVEGEKCVDILRSVGIAAITHPGHQRSEPSCRARYAGLLSVGVKKVFYISDNDPSGRKKAAAFLAAAQLAQIDFKVIPAESICEVPDGGSVDDMPMQQLGSLIAAAIRSAALTKPASISKISYASIKKALNEFWDSAPATFADVETGIADIAAEHKASPFDCKRIWDSIQEDRKASSEALSCKSAIMRRQELEARRKTIKLEDYLPESICPAIRELTGNLACDDLMAVSVVLTTAAGCFRAGHRIDVGDGMFVKEPVLWLLVAGPSGSGKSPIMRHLCRDRLKSVMAHYSQVSVTISQEWEMRYANIPKAKRPDKPRGLATCIGDFTTEELVRILGDNHEHGLPTFVYSEEIKAILGNFDEYKTGGKGKGKETFLTLFDGNVEASHRVGRQSKPIVGKVQNALLGAVQPGVFRKMIEGGDDAGLFARCLVVPVQDRYIEPKFFRTPEEIIAVNMAERCLDAFYLRCLGVSPTALRLDFDAVELFNVLWRDNYEKAQAVALESQRAILGKRLGYILQAALAMHLCKVAAGEISEDQLFLSKQTLARAVVLVDILQNYAIVEQQESQMQRHGAFDLNRKIHLHAKASNGITAYEFLTRYVPLKDRKFMTTQHVAAAMDQLVEMKLGEFQVKGNGRQTKIFVATGKYPD